MNTVDYMVRNRLYAIKIRGVNKKFFKTHGFIAKFLIVVYSVAVMSVTYQPKKRKRSKTHGFLVRSKTKDGRKVIARRRQKGRARIAV